MRWHGLRHTSATLAELMNRLGHASAAAALIYQHAAAGRDEEIARRLSAMAEGHSLADERSRPRERPGEARRAARSRVEEAEVG